MTPPPDLIDLTSPDGKLDLEKQMTEDEKQMMQMLMDAGITKDEALIQMESVIAERLRSAK